LRGNAEQTIAELKARVDGVLAVMGSGALIEALLRERLIDELLLMIHPVVLGSGRRLFPDGGPPAEFRLINAESTTTGSVIVAYETSRSD
jgi:dihydrofolate reductase